MKLNVVLMLVLIALAVGVNQTQFKMRVLQNQLYKAQIEAKKYKSEYERLKNHHSEMTNLANIGNLAKDKLQMVVIEAQAKSVGSITQALLTDKEKAQAK